MKKATKLIRNVWFKPKTPTSESPKPMNPEVLESALAQEIDNLRSQLQTLKSVVNKLQVEIENKDINLAKLAREKEKLSLDLLKQERVNTNLLKQLEEERKYYFEEKEIYCQEMNEYKELKRNMSNFNVNNNGHEKPMADNQSEIVNIKETLAQTLEANYNLSVKYLRMKNTKSLMKSELQKRQAEHDKIVNDLKTKIQLMQDELEEVTSKQISKTISPSNKKYLQLVQQNSSLMYENLCLQLEIDRLNFQFEKIKLHNTKSETNSRLKYMHSIKKDKKEISPPTELPKVPVKEKKKVRITEKTEIAETFSTTKSDGATSKKNIDEIKYIKDSTQKTAQQKGKNPKKTLKKEKSHIKRNKRSRDGTGSAISIECKRSSKMKNTEKQSQTGPSAFGSDKVINGETSSLRSHSAPDLSLEYSEYDANQIKFYYNI